jgi:hypothetical protein
MFLAFANCDMSIQMARPALLLRFDFAPRSVPAFTKLASLKDRKDCGRIMALADQAGTTTGQT